MANPLDSLKKLPTWGKVAVAAGGAGAVYLIWRAHENAGTTAAAATDTGLATPDASAGDGTGDGFPVGDGSGDVLGTTTGYSTAAAWSAAATAGLSEIGFDETTVADALGAYLAGNKLTAAQAAIVNDAKAEFDSTGLTLPPVVLAGTPTTITGNTTPAISNGHVVSVSNNEGVVGWTGANAKSYRVTLTGPGPENGRQATVSTPSATYGGLEAGHNYEVTVVPVGATGTTGKSGKISFKTTKGK